MLISFLVKTSHINEHGVYSLDIWMDDDSSQYIIIYHHHHRPRFSSAEIVRRETG